MVQISSPSLTLEAFLSLPETKPASEFIEGQIIQKPMPQGKHSTVQSDLVPAINTVLKPSRIARVYSELRCTFGGRSTVPDVSVFIWKRIPRDETGKVSNTFNLAPDWTIEILSPDQSQTRVVRNILHCLAHGTQMGWLIDPDEEVVFAYFPDRPPAVFEAREFEAREFEAREGALPDDETGRLPIPTFAESFSLTVSQLFSWLEA